MFAYVCESERKSVEECFFAFDKLNYELKLYTSDESTVLRPTFFLLQRILAPVEMVATPLPCQMFDKQKIPN